MERGAGAVVRGGRSHGGKRGGGVETERNDVVAVEVPVADGIGDGLAVLVSRGRASGLLDMAHVARAIEQYLRGIINVIVKGISNAWT